MVMSPRVRRLALTAHVTASVGWFGAVAVFLALAVTGLIARDALTVRSVYVTMGVTGRYVIVPLCFAALATGVASSLGTTWGLLRHYWITVKLTITALATGALLLHLPPISRLADAAASPAWTGDDLAGLRTQLVVQSGAALVVLLGATALSVYKPQGRTRYGQRMQQLQASATRSGAEAGAAG
ncbi:hypothetical protein [Streptomyces sp. NK15101]|uniref:hypothetical protein n=1 Tax=Streptomyces sp. NK15101 TaxID=2873261 RepID=UPI001CEC2C67|nr:hypothetical protein [Streptomyces sp. NK15101]